MSRPDSENMTISIGGTSYSVKTDSVDESGGDPEYTSKQAWNKTYYQVLTGYTYYSLQFNMIVDSVTDSLIDGFSNPLTLYTIILGNGTDYKTTFLNMQIESFKTSIKSVDGVMTVGMTFTAPGIRSNRVQA